MPDHPIVSLLTSPSSPVGLLPYLDTKFGGDWQRFQVKNYGFQDPNTFNSANNGSGYRLREPSSEAVSLHQVIYKEGVTLGKIFAMEGADQTDAINIWGQVDKAIREWGCQARGVVTDFSKLRIEGSRAIAQDRGVSSGKPGAYWHILIWRFDLEVYG